MICITALNYTVVCTLVLCSYELKRLRFSKSWDICQFPEQPAKDKRSYGVQNEVRFFLKLYLNIVPYTISRHDFVIIKEVCNGGVACSLLKLGSLEKTVIASLFHSSLHSGTIFVSHVILGNDRLCLFLTKNNQKNLCIDFFFICNFLF